MKFSTRKRLGNAADLPERSAFIAGMTRSINRRAAPKLSAVPPLMRVVLLIADRSRRTGVDDEAAGANIEHRYRPRPGRPHRLSPTSATAIAGRRPAREANIATTVSSDTRMFPPIATLASPR
jgi:hypothetical protein